MAKRNRKKPSQSWFLSLLKFAGRQPTALVIRTKVYEQLMLAQPLAVLEERTDTTPPVDFELICRDLREELKICVTRERELKVATVKAFPGQTELTVGLSKANMARNELADEIAFLWRAHKLGFSHDNLAIAVHSAERVLAETQGLLNQHQEFMVGKLKQSIDRSAFCFSF